MQLAMMTWRQVERYLEEKQTLIVPVGATEQHGPNGLIGTDHLVADGIARAVGERTNTIVHPALNLGMSLHHLDFAGTSSLSASTFGRVVTEVIESMNRHGFLRFLFINGHGGNNNAALAAISDLVLELDDLAIRWECWWTDPRVVELEERLFGGRNGDHATAAEISITRHLFPEAVGDIETCNPVRPAFNWPLSPAQFRATFPDGRMFSDPSLASEEAGRELFELSVDIYSEMIAALDG
ncbi:MAG: creatininase family protein [bacterium]|nr:creatininase family protein [bacterium]